MPGKKTFGKKSKGFKKNPTTPSQRELQFKEFGEEYARVLKMLGNRWCYVHCFDGVDRLAYIRNKLKKRTSRINIDDIVLVSIRDFNKSEKKCDILHRYQPQEVRRLEKLGEIQQENLVSQLDNVIFCYDDIDEKGNNKSEDEDEEEKNCYLRPMPEDTSDEEEEEEEVEDGEYEYSTSKNLNKDKNVSSYDNKAASHKNGKSATSYNDDASTEDEVDELQDI